MVCFLAQNVVCHVNVLGECEKSVCSAPCWVKQPVDGWCVPVMDRGSSPALSLRIYAAVSIFEREALNSPPAMADVSFLLAFLFFLLHIV